MSRHHSRRPTAQQTSWDSVAHWYDGWVGKKGSYHHRQLAIPIVMRLLAPKPGERILDVGAGQGVLCPYVHRSGARYTGVEAGERLVGLARRHHSSRGRFVVGDARRLACVSELKEGMFDAIVFMLSIQNMDPLTEVIGSAGWALRSGGRVVLLMTHPCFRPPRQSGWGHDPKRKLQYRRVDRYLSSFHMPEKVGNGTSKGKTTTFHRPLQAYVDALAGEGLLIDRIEEVACPEGLQPETRPRQAADGNNEIPLFLGLRARRA